MRSRLAINIDIARITNFWPTHARLPEPNGRNDSVLAQSLERFIPFKPLGAVNISTVYEENKPNIELGRGFTRILQKLLKVQQMRD